MEDSQGTHFFFITIQRDSAGHVPVTLSGTVTPRPGQTRLDLFNQTWAAFEKVDPRVRGGVVIAFDLQPNAL